MLFPDPETDRPADAEVLAATLARRVRWLLVFAAAILALGIAVARSVKPDERGYGTHERMGLGPCTFRILFNRPCPSCGMTTAWAYAARGQLSGAFRANAGGALLVVAAILAVPWLALAAACGRWPIRAPRSEWVAFGAAGIGIVTLIQWCIRLLVTPA